MVFSIRQKLKAADLNALARTGKLLGTPVRATAPVAFGAETIIDQMTFTHTQGEYEKGIFTSSFSLNAAGVAIVRYRYLAGAGPIVLGGGSAGTIMYEMLPSGSTSNGQISVKRLFSAAFQALASGTYVMAVTAQAAAGAASGTMNGTAPATRDFWVAGAGLV